jgi:hypothetical protein
VVAAEAVDTRWMKGWRVKGAMFGMLIELDRSMYVYQAGIPEKSGIACATIVGSTT